MNAEERLKRVRFESSSEGLRDRVLRAVSGMRRERIVWRRMWVAAAALLAVAIAVNWAASGPIERRREPDSEFVRASKAMRPLVPEARLRATEASRMQASQHRGGMR